MKIAVRFGHNTGVPGAHGILDEVTEDRKYGKAVINNLIALGHSVLDCTPNPTSTSAEDLNYGVNKANAWGADLFVSCHINACGGGAHGCEVIYAGGSVKGQEYATKACNAIVSLGFAKRGEGARPDVRGLYEPKATKMPCIIIEPFFLDNANDVALYQRIGYEALGKAIAEGISGCKVTTPVAPVADVKPKANADTLLIQQRMNRLKFVGANGSPLTEDGISGANTVFAIKKFQSVCGISADGIWGSQTENCFAQINSKPLCGLKYVQNVPTRYIQFRLGIAVDGIFGSGSEASVMAYQKSNEGLAVDGIFGQASWKVLIG